MVRSLAVQSNSNSASNCDCSTGKVFNNFSAFIVRKVRSSFLKYNLKRKKNHKKIKLFPYYLLIITLLTYYLIHYKLFFINYTKYMFFINKINCLPPLHLAKIKCHSPIRKSLFIEVLCISPDKRWHVIAYRKKI